MRRPSGMQEVAVSNLRLPAYQTVGASGSLILCMIYSDLLLTTLKKNKYELELISLFIFAVRIFSVLLCSQDVYSICDLTHYRLSELPICTLEDSNFDFRYVRLCDFDIPGEK